MRRLLRIAMATAALLMPAAASAQWHQVLERMHRLGDLDFPSATTGYVTSARSILKSTDAGLTWAPLTTPTSDTLNALYFTDEYHGFAAGNGGVILETTDGGATWSSIESGTSADLQDLYFIGHHLGFAVGEAGLVMKTTDGGQSWTSQKILESTEFEFPLKKILFPTPEVGFIMSSTTAIFKTTDGGATWKRLETESALGIIYDIHFLSKDVGFVASWYPWSVMKTTDGGTTWTGNGFSYPTAIDFLTPTTGWVVTSSWMARTTNTGETWGDTIKMPEELLEIGHQFHPLTVLSDTVAIALTHYSAHHGPMEHGTIMRITLPRITAGVSSERGSDDGVSIRRGAARGAVRVAFGEEIGKDVEITVTDLLGRAVAHRHYGEPAAGYVEEIACGPAGLYLVAVTVNGTRRVEKIIID